MSHTSGEDSSPPRLAMCAPGPFATHHLFNPWMSWREETDPRRAGEQWEVLHALLERLGCAVEVVAPAPGGAATFTRDAMVAVGQRILVLRNDGPRGDAEPAAFGAWLRRTGRRPSYMPRRMHLDGGNVVRCTDGRWLVGLKPGAAADAERWLGRLVLDRLSARCIGVPLADVRYLHLDMVLADLAGRAWLVYPRGFAEPDLGHESWRDVLAGRPVVEVLDDEAARLAANVVVVGETVVTGWVSARLRAAIEAHGLRVETSDLDEFRKAGGGAHCLTVEVPAPPDAGRAGPARTRPPRERRL